MPVIPPLENRVSAIAPKSRASSHSFSHNIHHDNQLSSDYANDRAFFELPYLELGDGVTYRMPSTYDDMAESLNIPNFLDIHVEEFYLKSTLDLESLSEMMGNDRKFGPKRHDGMGEAYPHYESLQSKLVALSLSNMDESFSLSVTEAGLNSSSVPEGAAGKIQRSIMSDGGVLQVYYVKVLEKGDGYEIIERSLPEKHIVKKSPMTIEKEEIEKITKIWVNIARRDIQKHHKVFISFHRKQIADAKRCSETCQREVKMKVSRSLKLLRGVSIRTRKLARDMLVYWKRVDKEMAELRKKEEKEAAEALKREQELREAKRQQQRLNFLLSQTELYSHFMQNKSSSQPIDGELPSGKDENLVTHETKQSDEDPEEAELKMEALKAAQDAVFKQKTITNAFDNECLKLRQDFDSELTLPDEPVADGSSMDLLHPSTMPIASSVQTPDLFKGDLKEYQLKGLQWLVNCYEQGLNGILADEMGLGKTIQAMAFLAHLAEEKNIWGPFLVVAPASVLNNWADEISRFCPELKTLPYWGGLQERIILRKNMNPKRLYRREAGFHILITSYQLLVSDEKYFRRVKWQYMVLDEAQAIKSANSIRWKTLLSFNCRNRLLLTGTPIQNNMAELWALLHFIMPTLFDSHEQFNEWFSKGIENHAEHGGRLNEHQLNRLHAVLKPFMLRRVKKDVISELTGKKEVTVHCELSSRQQEFYQAIKNKISLTELFDSSRGHLNEKKIMNLMNIVIQLRKVCNHPELFERNEGSTYFHFGVIPNALSPPPFGELEDVHYAGGRNPISYEIPKLVYNEFFSQSGDLLCRKPFNKYFNIFSEENIFCSSLSQENKSGGFSHNSGRFGFTRLLDLSASEVSFLAASSFLEKLLLSLKQQQQELDEIMDSFGEMDSVFPGTRMDGAAARAVRRMLLIPSKADISFLQRRRATGCDSDPFEALVLPHQDRLISNMRILHSTYTFTPRSQAPPIYAHCSDRNFSYEMMEHLHNPVIKKFMLGFARTSDRNGPQMPRGPPHPLIENIDLNLSLSQTALQTTYGIFGTCAPMQSFDPAKLLTDSGKLRTLDVLLRRLRAENHRVLLFAQMTKMLNILEDYMNYRKYRYLRLDGSSTIMDRRDMVNDFQHRSDIFVFLLSTRAGGLGINLTAADTVIFYESDWNPTLDLQAMDRAHRLGQTKEVTVYRLICKETVEEKILQRASQKSTVQELVMTGGHVQGELLAPEDVVSLLLDDPQLELKLKEMPLLFKDKQKGRRAPKPIHEEEPEILVEDEEDEEDDDDEDTAPSFEEMHLQPSGSRKRKAVGEKGGVQQSVNDANLLVLESDGGQMEMESKPKRHKRAKKKSVNDDFELGSMAAGGSGGGMGLG